MFTGKINLALAFCAGLYTPLVAQQNGGTLPLDFIFNGIAKSFSQSLFMDKAQVASHYKPSVTCIGPCVARFQAATDVETIGERDVIRFVTSQVANGTGILIDSRSATDRATGFIAASVNIPSALLKDDNPFLGDILRALGAQTVDDTMSFADALPLVVFDDGPSTGDAPEFINLLINAGYPADKIQYYRGGMLVWTALGLNTDANS